MVMMMIKMMMVMMMVVMMMICGSGSMILNKSAMQSCRIDVNRYVGPTL